MEALNSKERTIALLKFLGIFLVLIILIVWGVYYDYNMPTKERDMYKAENESLRGTQQNQHVILATMDSLYYQLGRYDNGSDSKMLLDIKIKGEISTLMTLSGSDSVSNFGKIINRAFSTYLSWYSDKQKIGSLGNTASSVSDKDKQIQKLTDDNKQMQRDLDEVRLNLKKCLSN